MLVELYMYEVGTIRFFVAALTAAIKMKAVSLQGPALDSILSHPGLRKERR